MKLIHKLILAGIVLVSGACPANALPDVAFTACPKPLQLYPRDLSTGFSEVTIAGTVLSSNCTQVSVAVTRAGLAYTNLTQALTYQAGQAPFAFTIPIYAELAGYDFTVQVTSNATAITVATATNVVAGDVLLINGQSNAVAAMYNGSANGNQSNWLRSFGYRAEDATTTTNNQNWYLAEGNADEGHGAVGQWGLRLGRWLVESNAVPVAILNGARGGQPISYFQRTDMNHTNVANNYGRLLWRVTQAGLANAVRAILWYQGETDADNAATHETGWLKVYANWRQDYPSLEKVYVCQLHAGCGPTTRELPDLRDRQRRFADRDSDIEVMSTTAVSSHTDNCHYAYDTGYRVIGESLFQLVQRDLYGVAAANINPPNPAYAYFSGANTNEVRIELRDTADALSWDSGAQVDFRLEGSAATPTNGYVSAHTIVLQFGQNVGAATGVSYLSHYGAAGPYVKNANGVGLLAFYNVPILAADPGGSPGAPTQLQAILVGANRVDLAWTPVAAAVSYLIRRNGDIIGSTAVGHFIDRGVQPGQTYFYQVAAVSTVATSTWTAAVVATPAAHNVFALVPEANDYFLLYQLDIGVDFQTVSTLDVPYSIDNSAIYTAGIQRVAYYLELQDNPGNPMRWVYVSLNAFTNNPVFLGVPVAAKGATFQIYVQDMNVYASTNTGLVTGTHLTTGNLEFWGYNSNPTNAAAIPGASNTSYDFGDQISTAGYYGSMQLHNYAAGQTLFAFNHWGRSGTDDIGIGNCACTNPDWYFSSSAPTWNVKRLYVLVLTDADNDTLPDTWEMAKFGTLNYGPNDDPDGDGFTNWEEWQAGTDPLQASSLFTAQQVTQEPTGFRITWASVPGKCYDIEYKDEMLPGSWNSLTSNVPASAGTTTDYLDTTAVGLPKRFYQIKLRSP